MNIFRRLSTRGLLALVGAVAVAGAAAAALAVTAFGGGGSTPPAEPLAQAVHDALSAPPVEGVSADISFSNHLFDATSLGALGAASPLLSGATGRLWITNDGHLRLELQSSAGDTEIVSDGTTLSVYDGSSNTAYELPLPQASSAPAAGTTPPSVAEIESALSALAAEADVSGATPDSVAGQPAYTVTVSPKTGGGLIGGVELSWDAATGVPLRVAVDGERRERAGARADRDRYQLRPGRVVRRRHHAAAGCQRRHPHAACERAGRWLRGARDRRRRSRRSRALHAGRPRTRSTASPSATFA